jgi:hypothetical protein
MFVRTAQQGQGAARLSVWEPDRRTGSRAQRHVAVCAPGWRHSGQPWRAFQRGFRLLRTNTLRPRRTTTDPAFCFNALSEFLAFIVHRPFGLPSLPLQVIEGATILLRSKFRPDEDPCDQSRRGQLERRRRLPPGGSEPLKHCACYRSCRVWGRRWWLAGGFPIPPARQPELSRGGPARQSWTLHRGGVRPTGEHRYE